MFVLDASVTMAWCFPDESSSYADAMLEKLTDTRAFVPGLWLSEVANILTSGERRGRLSEVAANLFMSQLESLPITVEQSSVTLVEKAVTIARRYGLTAYNATYLELAIRLQLPLATLDLDLATAARSDGVSVINHEHNT